VGGTEYKVSKRSMNYYKKLDLDHNILTAQTLSYVCSKTDVLSVADTNFWIFGNTAEILSAVPEMTNIFEKKLGLTIDLISFIRLNKPCSPIHIDTDIVASRINFPVLNCTDTETRFFKLIPSKWLNRTPTPFKEYQKNGLYSLNFRSNQCEQVDSVALNAITVLRVNQPHQVVLNHTTYPRISCTIRFKESLEHLL